MSKRVKIIISICAALALLLAAAFAVAYFVYQLPLFDGSGWVTNDNGQVQRLDYYCRPVTEWQTIDGDRYYFDPADATMHTGWLEQPEGRYYFSEDGKLQTGWLEQPEGCYYLTENGIMQIGWLALEAEHYYFAEDGKLQTGWHLLNEKQYYFDEDGAMAVGWQETDKGRCYFDEEGSLCVGWLEQPEGRYYLGENGSMQVGWVETDEGSRFFDKNGLLQENWQQTAAGKKYLDADGKYHTGWLETETWVYYFNKKGIMQTGWITDTKGRFYLYEDGTFATGFVEIDGIKRYFLPTGEYILLCNRWNPVPDDYKLKLVSIGKFKMDATCADAMEQMMAAAKKDGVTLKINNTYRSKALQQSMWESRRKKYMGQGMTLEEADAYIGRSVAVPGTSEHQTGLAADIKGSEEVYAWLAENSWKYGFILRYPDDKIDITGIIYEPWHFRYVGTSLAKDIYDSGLCLEEYLEQLEASAK